MDFTRELSPARFLWLLTMATWLATTWPSGCARPNWGTYPDGQVVTTIEPGGGAASSLTLSLDPSADLDAELAATGYAVRLTQATAKYWRTLHATAATR
jgi:hypothetical protein